VELGAAIAWENYRARSNRVFGFGSEGFYKENPAAAEDEFGGGLRAPKRPDFPDCVS